MLLLIKIVFKGFNCKSSDKEISLFKENEDTNIEKNPLYLDL